MHAFTIRFSDAVTANRLDVGYHAARQQHQAAVDALLTLPDLEFEWLWAVAREDREALRLVFPSATRFEKDAVWSKPKQWRALYLALVSDLESYNAEIAELQARVACLRSRRDAVALLLPASAH